MSNSNGVITAPISVTGDLASVLGRATGDVGQLCGDVKWDSTNSQWVSADATNKWAKYKATRATGVNPTDAYKGEQKSLYGSTGYMCGLSAVLCTALSGSDTSLKTVMDNGAIGWEYEAPRGLNGGGSGVHEYYRVLDFDGYNHNAVSPFYGFSDTGGPADTDFNIYMYVDFTATDSSLLGFSDLTIFNDWYFGIAIWKGNTFIGAGTSQSKISTASDASRRVDFKLPTYAEGSCYLYPFFTPEKRSWSTTNPFANNRFVPHPMGRQPYTVVSGNPLANLTYTWGSGGSVAARTTDWRITVTLPSLTGTNGGSASVTVYKSYIYMELSLMKISDMTTRWSSGDVTLSLTGNVAIAAGGSGTIVPASTSKIMSNPSGTAVIAGTSSTMSIGDFIYNTGGEWSDYRKFVHLNYYYNNIYYRMATIEL